MLQARVEDYHSLSRQMNENTFGNILPPIFSPNTPNDTLQLRSPTGFDSVINPLKQDNEQLRRRIDELEATEEKLQRERGELWDRIRSLEKDADLRVEDLICEAEGIKKQALQYQ